MRTYLCAMANRIHILVVVICVIVLFVGMETSIDVLCKLVKQPFKFFYVDLIIITKVIHNKYNNELMMKLLYSHIDEQPAVSPTPPPSKSKLVIIIVIC